MKNILLISLLFIGCEGSVANSDYAQEILNKAPVVIRNGCEYYAIYGRYTTYLHVGNCKNPVHYFKTGTSLYKYNIVLPEEYPLIGTDPKKPDTFTAYASQDTIYFKFK